jgi:hypothetical protein
MPAGETLRAFLFHGRKGYPMPEDNSIVEITWLRADNEKLIAVVNEYSTRFAAINFRAYEMAEEIRNLEMRLSGTEASYRCIEWENDHLRAEVQFLRKVLLDFSDPPPAIRELVAAYREEMESRGQSTKEGDK